MAGNKKKSRRLRAPIAFTDESGFQLLPSVRRTYAPRGKTPVLTHTVKREKVSAISSLLVSPQRKRVRLVYRFQGKNVNGQGAARYLRALRRHVRGPVIVVWDGAKIHRAPEVKELLRERKGIYLYTFPAYSPDFDPDEQVWNNLKGRLANEPQPHARALHKRLRAVACTLQRNHALLSSFVFSSQCPLRF